MRSTGAAVPHRRPGAASFAEAAAEWLYLVVARRCFGAATSTVRITTRATSTRASRSGSTGATPTTTHFITIRTATTASTAAIHTAVIRTMALTVGIRVMTK